MISVSGWLIPTSLFIVYLSNSALLDMNHSRNQINWSTAVVAGMDYTLRCEHSLNAPRYSICWDFISARKFERWAVYINGKLRAFGQSRNYDVLSCVRGEILISLLSVTSVEMDYAGIYACFSEIEDKMYKEIDLVVLGK